LNDKEGHQAVNSLHQQSSKVLHWKTSRDPVESAVISVKNRPDKQQPKVVVLAAGATAAAKVKVIVN